MSTKSYPVISALILMAFHVASCQGDMEPWAKYRTHSKVFNDLLKSAQIDVVDLENHHVDTLKRASVTHCITADTTSALKSLTDAIPINDSLMAIVSLESGMFATLNLKSGAITPVALEGLGPGEVYQPSSVELLGDTLYVLDPSFVHVFDKNVNYVHRFYNRDKSLQRSRLGITDKFYIHKSDPSNPTTGFYIRQRNEEQTIVKEIFPPIVDTEEIRKKSPRYHNFSAISFRFNKKNELIAFKYYSKPFLFISDLNGKIQKTIRMESNKLISSEPHYSINEISPKESNPLNASNKKFGEYIQEFYSTDSGEIHILYDQKKYIILKKQKTKYNIIKIYYLIDDDDDIHKTYFTRAEIRNDKLIASSIFSDCVHVFDL